MPAWIAEGLHRTAIGHLVPAKANVPGLRSSDPDTTLHVGPGAVVDGDLELAGAVVLAAGVRVLGNVVGGHEVVVGPRCHIAGTLRATGRVVVQDGARILGNIRAGSDAHLLGDCIVANVSAVGDIVVVGSPQAGRLDPGGRIQTRPW